MPDHRPTREDIAAARYFVAARARMNLDPADAEDLARTSWATLRLARPDMALPPAGARIVTVPRAVFEAHARPGRPMPRPVSPEPPKGAA